ncbi:uncharacterized protein MONBRDRAFT_8595 [Monosiga brevicollis MX1]|uniref:Uncharacterized protein n=1 Tax=Monosiga brevicollis TaxID=81824 RepID=A9V0I5_MONBE|nr:uncharacterized protein MONBRDRAFT_8595 [Monosiga brevicollis MX1]EDQ89159.1 predicted protein [Monosiga brevicollis MX1]|eukprot:XP_001746264.1 hypothetical protein [Monosiga brevicollis MX1]
MHRAATAAEARCLLLADEATAAYLEAHPRASIADMTIAFLRQRAVNATLVLYKELEKPQIRRELAAFANFDWSHVEDIAAELDDETSSFRHDCSEFVSTVLQVVHDLTIAIADLPVWIHALELYGPAQGLPQISHVQRADTIDAFSARTWNETRSALAARQAARRSMTQAITDRDDLPICSNCGASLRHAYSLQRCDACECIALHYRVRARMPRTSSEYRHLRVPSERTMPARARSSSV